MIEINTETKWYDLIVRGVSTVAGFAASYLVGSLFNSVIDNSEGAAKGLLELGRLGIEGVVTYDVASSTNEEIREYVDGYNKFARNYNEVKKLEDGENESMTIEVSNG